jgi:iron complex transport system substrate-binding protein
MTSMALSAAHLQAADSPRNLLPIKPQRVVTMNVCADDLVLRIADLQNIASVTYLARNWGDPRIRAVAERVPINHGLAEEIIPLDPDLVIAGMYTTRTTVALLRRTGTPLIEQDVPKSIEAIRRQYLEYGDILGEPERAGRIVADMDERLAKLAAEPIRVRLRALVLNANGLVGEGSLANEVMARAGLENVAATLKMEQYYQAPLEMVVSQGLDILILSAARDGPPAMATQVLNHPVLQRMARRIRIFTMPAYLWSCGGPGVVEAVEMLSRVVKDVRSGALGQ